jgi:hypothetical protein
MRNRGMQIFLGILVAFLFVVATARWAKTDFRRYMLEPMTSGSGSENVVGDLKFVGPSGGEIAVNSDGSGLTLTHEDGSVSSFEFTGSDTYSGPNGNSVTIHTAADGTKQATLVSSDGQTSVYYVTDSVGGSGGQTGQTSASQDNYNHYTKSTHPVVFYAPSGKAQIIHTSSGATLVITDSSSGEVTVFYISGGSTKSYVGPNGATATIFTDKNGDKAVKVAWPNGRTVVYTIHQQSSWSSEQAQYDDSEYNSGVGSSYNTVQEPISGGVRRRDIPDEDLDLYVLKSSINNMTCPKCPDNVVITKPAATECPACPPCGRCPQPAFTCRKVPDYGAIGSENLPQPVLNNFSSFGM